MDAHVRRFLSLSRVCKLSSCRCPDRLEWAVLDDADGGAWAYARGVLPGLVFGGVCCTLRQSALTLEEHAIKSRKFYIDPPNQDVKHFWSPFYIYFFVLHVLPLNWTVGTVGTSHFSTHVTHVSHVTHVAVPGPRPSHSLQRTLDSLGWTKCGPPEPGQAALNKPKFSKTSPTTNM